MKSSNGISAHPSIHKVLPTLRSRLRAFDDCKEYCQEHYDDCMSDPDADPDECSEMLSACIEGCDEQKFSMRYTTRSRSSSRNGYGDCLYECREGYLACTDMCRDMEPGDPECYEWCSDDRSQCDKDCDDEYGNGR